MERNNPFYEETFETLKRSRLFGALTESELKSLLKIGKYETYDKNETIENDEGTELLNIVVKGEVKISQFDPKSGRSITLFILRPGDIFDLFSLLDGKKHLSLATALQKCALLRIPMESARELFEKIPELNSRMLPYLGARMRELESFSEALVFDDTATRLAKLILKHTHPEKGDSEHFPVKLINRLTHETIAEMIGSVRSVVTTQLKKMKEEGVIINRQGKLLVKELESLKDRYNL